MQEEVASLNLVHLVNINHQHQRHKTFPTPFNEWLSTIKMSQEYQPQKGKGKAPTRPQYMTVGNGSISESANRLQAILDNDSGYEGSLAAGSNNGAPVASGWNPSLTEDRPTPAHTPTARGETSAAADNERQVQATAIHQLWYNQHRSTLGRTINRAVETLKGLQEMNAKWPVTYPSVQSSELSKPHPALVRTQTTLSESKSSPQPGRMQRSQTSLGESSTVAGSSKEAEEKAPEPRLVSQQIAQQFSILKLDLKVGHLHQTDLVHSLEKSSIASLLDGQISSSIKHLRSLRERIEDTSSKVLVTGDVNVGKSTFCNALLRRKVLPEDQLQNTSIFCEVLDSRENGGVEEVHAIHKDTKYDRHDESTYDVFSLSDLETLVTEKDTYNWCKIYLKDVRSIDKSLLNNGVVDISIIDAPSLNRENEQTTAVFARQEEIDVVVFVVSAANQITLSAREFIFAADNEKAYIFMVVNGYEVIKDKERFQKEILKQIGGLSQQTLKNSAELVHFVSSNAIPTVPHGAIQGGNGGSGSSGGGGGDGPDFDDGSDPNGKGKDKDKIQDFERLEESLRRFVLEKRARSKLAPAKTYLLNVLGDVYTLVCHILLIKLSL
jgi:mitofusin